MKFNSLKWHDSIIERVVINSGNLEKDDSIQIEVLWSSGNIITFRDVYWSILDMNFGVVAPESILKAYTEGNENEMVKELYKRSKGMLNSIELNFLEIETNSTNSKIRIIAKSFEIENTNKRRFCKYNK